MPSRKEICAFSPTGQITVIMRTYLDTSYGLSVLTTGHNSSHGQSAPRIPWNIRQQISHLSLVTRHLCSYRTPTPWTHPMWTAGSSGVSRCGNKLTNTSHIRTRPSHLDICSQTMWIGTHLRTRWSGMALHQRPTGHRRMQKVDIPLHRPIQSSPMHKWCHLLAGATTPQLSSSPLSHLPP